MMLPIFDELLSIDLLKANNNKLNLEAFSLLLQQGKNRLTSSRWQEVIGLMQAIDEEVGRSGFFTLVKDTITISFEKKLPIEAQSKINTLIQRLIPWRIGPYDIDGIQIESEWNSSHKFGRVQAYLENQPNTIKGKKVLDLGCSNGYFSFRLLNFNPELLFCFDPLESAMLQLLFICSLFRTNRIIPALASHQNLKLFPNYFDTIFCLGVLYHRRDPFLFLRTLHSSIKNKGRLILETLVLPQEDNSTFTVPERYCGMRNVYLIPSLKALELWLKRNGFVAIDVIDVSALNSVEQRRTPHAPFHSLEDFLDGNDSTKTIEGFNAPYRATLIATVLK